MTRDRFYGADSITNDNIRFIVDYMTNYKWNFKDLPCPPEYIHLKGGVIDMYNNIFRDEKAELTIELVNADETQKPIINAKLDELKKLDDLFRDEQRSGSRNRY